MARKTIPLANNEFYHIVNRGVEKRNIFLDDEDRLRFINSLLVFNDHRPAPWNLRKFWENHEQGTFYKYTPEKPFVEIHAVVLMPNHFHLLLKQIREHGISQFMRKIGGYASYFNKRYQRVGSLFQGRFKVKFIETERQLINTYIYIHTNPIELVEPQWKEFKINNLPKTLNFLENFRWSSYLDYTGKNNFENVITRDFFLDLFGGESRVGEMINQQIAGKISATKFTDCLFE